MYYFEHFRLNPVTALRGLTNTDPLLGYSKIKKEKNKGCDCENSVKAQVEIASVTLRCCDDVFGKVIINGVTFFFTAQRKEN